MQRFLLLCVIVFCSPPARAQFLNSPAADSGAVDLSDPKYVMMDLKGEYQGQRFGQAMLNVCDCNHDGYSDYCVTRGFGYREFRTDIYLGGKHPSATPYQISLDGKATATGDLNRDGKVDLVTWVTHDDGDPLLGTVSCRIFLGTDSGFDTVNTVEIADTVDYYFGSQAFIADIDNDSENELIVLSGHRPSVFVYKFADTGLVREPWFVWDIPAIVTNNGPWLQVADVDNNAIKDLVYWDAKDKFQLFILWGKRFEKPDAQGVFRYESANLSRHFPASLAVAPVISNSGNDFLLRNIISTSVFHFSQRLLNSSDLDTTLAKFDLYDPKVRDAQLDYNIYSVVPLDDINGSKMSSVLTGGNVYAFFNEWPAAAFLYSAGNALNDKFDAALALTTSTEGDPPGTPVDIGDIDGDSLHEIAIPDLNYNPNFNGVGAGRVLIIRGSRDYPHVPVRVNIAQSDIPISSGLFESYPNPFVKEATIRFAVSTDRDAVLSITDELGRVVESHKRFSRGAGVYELGMNAASWPAGTYVCRLFEGTRVKRILIHCIH